MQTAMGEWVVLEQGSRYSVDSLNHVVLKKTHQIQLSNVARCTQLLFFGLTLPL